MMYMKKNEWTGTVLFLALFLMVPAVIRAQEAADKPAAKADTPADVPASPMALLKAIPEDATAFVAIRSLGELDKDLIGIARSLGFPLGGPDGMFPGPLDWAKEAVGLKEGLDTDGSAAIVVMSCREVQSIEGIHEKAALFLPAAKPAAVIEQLGGEKGDGPVTVTLMGESLQAVPLQRYVVLARQEETLKAIVAAKGEGIIKTMAPDRVKAFAERDLFGWVNFRGISPQIREEVGTMLKGVMAMAGQGDEAEAEQSLKELNKVFDSTVEASLAISLDQRGLDISGYFRADPASEMGKQMAAVKGAEGSLLFALPNEPTILAIGASGRGPAEMQEKQIREGLDQLLNEKTVGDFMTAEQLATLKGGITKVLSGVEAASLSLSNLPPADNQGLVGMVFILKTGDAKQWMEESRKVFSQSKDALLKVAKEKEGLDEDEIKAISEGVQWKTKAEQVGGADVDQLAVDLGKLPEIKDDKESLDQVKAIAGPEGITMRLGAIGDKYVLIAFGGGAKRFEQIAQQISRGESPLSTSESIQKIAKRLPAGPKNAEAYINLDQILAMVSAISVKVNQPLPFPLMMKNAAPIAMTSNKVDAAAQEVHLLVPMELVLSVKEMATPLMPMLMGGGMGGQGSMNMDMEEDESDEKPAKKGELK